MAAANAVEVTSRKVEGLYSAEDETAVKAVEKSADGAEESNEEGYCMRRIRLLESNTDVLREAVA